MMKLFRHYLKFRTKISDVKADGTYCIESIVLKVPERREIQTKSGESIVLSGNVC